MLDKFRESVKVQAEQRQAETAAAKSAAAATPEMMVREYKNARAFNNDAKKLAKKGWTVVSTTDSKASSGAGRKAATVAMPVLLFLPHASHVVVTYQRARR